MKLESVTVWPGGLFEFSHQDGDLFWGHWIEISGDLVKGLRCASISG
jgi:hypothetical protein